MSTDLSKFINRQLDEGMSSIDTVIKRHSSGKNKKEAGWIIDKNHVEPFLKDAKKAGFKIDKTNGDWIGFANGEMAFKVMKSGGRYVVLVIAEEDVQSIAQSVDEEKRVSPVMMSVARKLNDAFRKRRGYANLDEIGLTGDEMKTVEKYAQRGKHGLYVTLRGLEAMIKKEGINEHECNVSVGSLEMLRDGIDENVNGESVQLDLD